MGCVTCQREPTTLTYVLIEHSPVTVGRRGRDRIERRVLEPFRLQLCSDCLARLVAARRRAKLVARISLGGIAVACGYLVGAIVGAPTPVVLALLFGGFATFLIGAGLMILMQRALIASLPIRENRGRNILIATTDRAELDRELDKQRLASAEIRNELERDSDAEPLPVARITPRVPDDA